MAACMLTLGRSNIMHADQARDEFIDSRPDDTHVPMSSAFCPNLRTFLLSAERFETVWSRERPLVTASERHRRHALWNGSRRQIIESLPPPPPHHLPGSACRMDDPPHFPHSTHRLFMPAAALKFIPSQKVCTRGYELRLPHRMLDSTPPPRPRSVAGRSEGALFTHLNFAAAAIFPHNTVRRRIIINNGQQPVFLCRGTPPPCWRNNTSNCRQHHAPST